jgi:hypothetical protein
MACQLRIRALFQICIPVEVAAKPPWPNGQGVGLLIRRLRARVPQGVALARLRA